ncbi:PREDICTED: 2-acylglycerol O-acyltransferase 1-like [Priapulus caudatus]|uniref:Acyltransferase n=1 Tax=Priapulus caudatus TaxID=37621 RepID=A0ABM1EJ47_PRICU|nr:PREDICTED: 2-acylglycerol O-acyltransferase 1-like [Priapulus caudatus]
MTYVGQFLDKYPDAGKPVAKLETAKENGTEETDGSDEFEKLEAPVEEALVSSVAADSFLAAPPSDTVYSNKEEEEEKEEEKEEEEEEEDHATVMGVEFAPMNIPLERRLQTAAVIHIVATFMFASFGSIFFCIYLLLCTRYWWLVLIYISWMLFDRDSCNRGGRRSEWVRNWPMWAYYRDYFPITLRRTAELDPNRNYVFGYHPHGIMGVGAFCNFGLNGKYFLEKFPGIKPYLLTLEGLFWFPLDKMLSLFTGVCSVSKESIEWILTKEGKGNAAVIIVGGAVEALEAHPGGFNVKLKTRKGFVKMALKHGASLVPVYSFGENDVFDQTENPEGSLLRNIQNVLTKYLGFAPPIFHGRGVFNYTFGLLPFRKPVTTIVGKPIDLEKVEEPDNELVDKTHDIYTRALCRLFDDHKAEFGIPEETTLTIV